MQALIWHAISVSIASLSSFDSLNRFCRARNMPKLSQNRGHRRMGDDSGCPRVRFRCNPILPSNRCRCANSHASSKAGILVISVALEIRFFVKASTIARLVSTLNPKSSAFTMIFRVGLRVGISIAAFKMAPLTDFNARDLAIRVHAGIIVQTICTSSGFFITISWKAAMLNTLLNPHYLMIARALRKRINRSFRKLALRAYSRSSWTF
jgi:hypothetical protein